MFNAFDVLFIYLFAYDTVTIPLLLQNDITNDIWRLSTSMLHVKRSSEVLSCAICSLLLTKLIILTYQAKWILILLEHVHYIGCYNIHPRFYRV